MPITTLQPKEFKFIVDGEEVTIPVAPSLEEARRAGWLEVFGYVFVHVLADLARSRDELISRVQDLERVAHVQPRNVPPPTPEEHGAMARIVLQRLSNQDAPTQPLPLEDEVRS